MDDNERLEKIHSITTFYKGVSFRSRLEATWAAFFDLMRWQWEYEPIDFKGWIPDFAIYGESIIYAEVKPYIRLHEYNLEQYEKSYCRKEILLLGQTTPLPSIESDNNNWPMLGWLLDRAMIIDVGGVEHQDDCGWEEAAFGIWAGTNKKGKNPQDSMIGFCHTTGSFYDRITGHYDGGSFGSASDKEIRKIVEFYWAQAKNETQWRKG